MPASKYAHVLAVLRKNLSLNQSELAKMVRCSVSTIQSIELNRLQLSKSLAAEIILRTGADLDWLLANDLDTPMRPRHWIMNYADAKGFESRQDQAYTTRLLTYQSARRLPARRKVELR